MHCVVDIEANGLLPEATRIWCVVAKDIVTDRVYKFYERNLSEAKTFLDGCEEVIMHNGLCYDIPLLAKLWDYHFKGTVTDTLIMSRLYNPKRYLPRNCPNKKAGPHSIEAWGYRVGRGKPEHNDWSRLARQEQAGWLVDVKYLRKSIKLLDHWIRKIDEAVVPMLPMKLEVDETKVGGIHKHVQKPFLKNGYYNKSVVNWIESSELPKCIRAVSGPFTRVHYRKVNINSNAEIKEYLLDIGWVPDQWNTNDEGERTSPKLSKDEEFFGIQSSLGRLIAKRVQARSRRSILEGFLNRLRPDGRLPSRVTNLAVTGRATHAGIVNVPGEQSFFGKQMRRCFIASPGKVLVGTDSDACQIRMLAGRMQDPQYIDTIVNGDSKKGTDMHSINQRAANLPTRAAAKTFFYGFLFGAGDAKVGRIVNGTAQDGRRLKNQFIQGLPALGKLLDKLTKEWKSHAKCKMGKYGYEYYNGWVKGLDGRPIFIPSQHQILVYVLQSDEAIMMAAAYVMFHKTCLKEGFVWGRDYQTLCWYHDEWTVECKPQIAKRIGRLAEESIAKAGKFYNIMCPHIGQAKIGNDWFEIH
jgi:hypothetical protein